MITIIASSFEEINKFANRGVILKHYSENNLDIKNIEFNSKNIQIIKSGVGIKNARIAANYAVNNLKSEKIYFVGVCGALDSSLKIGDIIVFRSNRKDPIIHRVVKKMQDGDEIYFQTKGDNNEDSIKNSLLDETNLKEDVILGKAVFRVPLLGYIKIWFVDILKFMDIIRCTRY
ncbi:MAG: signal peptidase I [Candidatus Dadabacteria bacterium]|nr:signal peptidase I [Candidatus Dadabacteria bacterium]